jgi:hypothetical protein
MTWTYGHKGPGEYLIDCMMDGIAMSVGISHVHAAVLPVYQLKCFCLLLLLDALKQLQPY